MKSNEKDRASDPLRRALQQGDPAGEAGLAPDDRDRMRRKVLAAAEAPGRRWLPVFRPLGYALAGLAAVTVAWLTLQNLPQQTGPLPVAPPEDPAVLATQNSPGEMPQETVVQDPLPAVEAPLQVAVQPVEEPSQLAAPPVSPQAVAPAVLPPREPRQMQFVTGTTRVIWTLDPDFDLGPSRSGRTRRNLMKIPMTWRLAAIGLVLMLMTPAVFAAEGDPVTSSKFYQVHYLRPGMVEVLAKQACGGNFRHQHCNMSWGSEGFVQFTGTEEQQDTLAAALAERDIPPPTQIFQVHVLRAKTESKDMPALPQNAVQALNDLMQLLPYKGFELVDSGLMRTSSEAQLYLGSERRYEAHLHFEGDPRAGKPLQIQFSLMADKLVRDDAGNQVSAGTVRLIATTFSMKVGETVVVGTSKLNGGSDALVVLLSAGS